MAVSLERYQWCYFLIVSWLCSYGIDGHEIGDFEIVYSYDRLNENGWSNQGTLGPEKNLPQSSVSGRGYRPVNTGAGSQIPALCFGSESDPITFIDYDTNSAVRPELTMEVWVYPTARSNVDWILGHDDHGYDRAIALFDSRYGGIAAPIGSTYQSTISYPELNRWTQVVVTYSKWQNKATVYKNGGDGVVGGRTQSVNIASDSGSVETQIGLNGLKNFRNHNFVGCFAKIRITDRVVDAAEVEQLYKEFIDVVEPFQIVLQSQNLRSSGWQNTGALGSQGDIPADRIKGGGVAPKSCQDKTVLCFFFDSITYLNYNTNSAVTPELTMEVWVYPYEEPTGKDWILGHDDGGFDRAIVLYDERFGGIAAPIGRAYASTVSYPELNEWTQVVVTYSVAANQATVYKNGGELAGGQTQQMFIENDSGSRETQIGVNGLKNYANHNFVGCFAKIRITNRVVDAQEVADSYNNQFVEQMANDPENYQYGYQ